jgi:hypothetical protein
MCKIEKNRSEPERFMEVGLGPNEGCSAKGKKRELFIE